MLLFHKYHCCFTLCVYSVYLRVVAITIALILCTAACLCVTYYVLYRHNVTLMGNNSDKHTLSIKINNELSNIQEWLNINKAFLKCKKTKYMIFHNYQCDIKSCIPDVRINKIVRLQKRAIRVIRNSKYNAHVEPLLKKLNLLKISDIFRNSLLKLYYKYKSGNLPHYVMHMFSTEPNVHRYNTRSSTILNHPVTNLFGSKKCVRYHLPRLIEETDSNILKNWTHIAVLDSVCISEKFVYKVTCLNATSQMVTHTKMYHVDMKYGCCMYTYIFLFALLYIIFLIFFPFIPFSFCFLSFFSLFLYCSSSFIIVVFDDTHL